MREVPNVPTLKELGIDVEYAVNRGLVAPKGTPAAVLAKLGQACGDAAKDSGVRRADEEAGHAACATSTPRATPRSWRRTTTLNKGLAKDLGLLKR